MHKTCRDLLVPTALEDCLANQAALEQRAETLVPAEFRGGTALGNNLIEIQSFHQPILES